MSIGPGPCDSQNGLAGSLNDEGKYCIQHIARLVDHAHRHCPNTGQQRGGREAKVSESVKVSHDHVVRAAEAVIAQVEGDPGDVVDREVIAHLAHNRQIG